MTLTSGIARAIQGPAMAMGFAAYLGVAPAAAQSERMTVVPSDQIERALKGSSGRRTRGIGSSSTVSDTDRATVRGLIQTRRTRGWNEHDRAQFLDATQRFPQIDFEIYFDLNSADIRPESLPQLNELARALSSAGLQQRAFVVAGHTDRRGGAEYNQSLSQRRAAAVRNYLISRAGVAGEALEAEGFGFTRLKNLADPYAAENRRVQLINLTP